MHTEVFACLLNIAVVALAAALRPARNCRQHVSATEARGWRILLFFAKSSSASWSLKNVVLCALRSRSGALSRWRLRFTRKRKRRVNTVPRLRQYARRVFLVVPGL